MKSVLISIQPKWVEKIASGKKTIEVRKSRPKLETPFKCYIYCTIGNGMKGDYFVPSNIQCGKVIGEFICDKIDEVYQCNSGWVKENGCISQGEFFDYLGIPRGTHFGYDKKAYAWHISNLKIYDKPKELSEFSHYVLEYTVKDGSNYSSVIVTPLKRPPQSWCKVESLGE